MHLTYNMAPKKIIQKETTKLTDAEKKKIKAENKAKANPAKSEKKEAKNLERQYNRGQLKRPNEVQVVEDLNKEDEDCVETKVMKDEALMKAERSRILALKLASFKKTNNDIRE